MKAMTLIATFVALGSPAFADGGVHVHPHGLEVTLTGLAVITVALLVFALRR